ncbi:MAG TPA: RagB/SusD family nutrient uptake outer membrane protein, partial [Chitinophagaceae bacterium]|nr:RagB/SusD family nutrient uptake outer membrane protein [Chitinophagaceae bacterium]
MKQNIRNKIIILLAPAVLLTACKIETIVDPNNPSSAGIVVNASLSELQNLVTGTESAMRESISFYLDDVSVIGREIYRFSTSDPRFTSDLLGKGS